MKHQNGILILIFSFIFVEKDVMSLKPKCTVDQVLLGSGPFANENVKINVQARRQKRLQASLPDICDDGTIAAKRCSDHEKSFFKNFRTINGECNNLENPLLGSSFSKLSRLLPPEHSKFNKTTYFIKPDKPGKFRKIPYAKYARAFFYCILKAFSCFFNIKFNQYFQRKKITC